MVSFREMQDFSKFLLQRFALHVEWSGASNVFLTRGGIPVYRFHVIRRKKKIILEMIASDKEESDTRRFMQLVRFHVSSRRNDVTVRCLHFYNFTENDCKRKRCFAYLRDAFSEEWLSFQTGGTRDGDVLQTTPSDQWKELLTLRNWKQSRELEELNDLRRMKEAIEQDSMKTTHTHGDKDCLLSVLGNFETKLRSFVQSRTGE